MTHTYALLEISTPAFNEIAQKLKKAGYDHAFTGTAELDMHGIGLAPSAAIEAAVSDQLMYTFLTQHIGLDAGRASNALLDFRELRHGSRLVVIPS